MTKTLALFLSILAASNLCETASAGAVRILSWDLPQTASLPKRSVPSAAREPENGDPPGYADALPVQYPSEDFDPVLEPGMFLVIESPDETRSGTADRTIVPIVSERTVSVPAAGALDIVGKPLSRAQDLLLERLNGPLRTGLLMGSVQTVQVLGKVQRPGNYPGYRRLSFLLAEAMDRAPGGTFKVYFYNGADRGLSVLDYEEAVKGRNNPFVPPGSIVYLPPSAGALFGEMTEKQVNLAYLVVITLGALGVTALARQ